jgi:NTP pyrophosphatase (non-canonical NTP hydrolase)
MDFDDYQNFTSTTLLRQDLPLVYAVLGLSGEAGEVAEKMKKIIRDKNNRIDADDTLAFAKELGDVLWYIARISHQLGIPLSLIAELNMVKLQSRKSRRQISGSGDNR